MVGIGNKMEVFFITILTIKFIRGSAAAPDCSKYPTSDIYSCCPFAIPYGNALVANCERIIKSKKLPTGTDVDNCIAECFFEQMFSNGKLDLAKVKKELNKDNNAGPEYAPFIEKVLIACDDQVRKIMKSGPPRPDPSYCKPFFGILSNCTDYEFILQCPQNKWKNNEICESYRNYFKACPFKA